jgi:hypothetical protein
MGLLYLYLYFDGVQLNNDPITSSGTSTGDNVWLEQIKQQHNFEERNTVYVHWSPKLLDFHYVTEHPSGKKIPHVCAQPPYCSSNDKSTCLDGMRYRDRNRVRFAFRTDRLDSLIVANISLSH